jgi:hypothetical protein
MTQPVLERVEHAMSNVFEMALFEPEAVLPAQMSWGARRWRHLRARALMLAILGDAKLCIERGRRRRHHHTRQLAVEAESWVRSDSREWLFSFASICDALGIDADALRGRLLPGVEHRASGEAAIRALADHPSTRSPVALLGPQRGCPRASIAAGAARRTARAQDAGSASGARAAVGVA